MVRMNGTGCIFPCFSPRLTAHFYVERLGFVPAYHLEEKWPHIILRMDGAVLILTESRWKEVVPNRQLYGEGYDACFYTDDPEQFYHRCTENGLKTVSGIETDEEGNPRFVLEDVDGRWIVFAGRKTEEQNR